MQFCILFFLQGYAPGLIGVSHGALQFMAYEEVKKGYSQYFGTPINKKLVMSFIVFETFRLRLEQRHWKNASRHSINFKKNKSRCAVYTCMCGL